MDVEVWDDRSLNGASAPRAQTRRCRWLRLPTRPFDCFVGDIVLLRAFEVLLESEPAAQEPRRLILRKEGIPYASHKNKATKLLKKLEQVSENGQHTRFAEQVVRILATQVQVAALQGCGNCRIDGECHG